MLWFKNKFKTIRDELLESVTVNEGFESKPYIDVLVRKAPEHHGIPPDELAIIEKHLDKLKLTFGNGLTYITEDESKEVVKMRLANLKQQIAERYPYIKNNDILDILTEMAFQMGLRGLAGFKNMHKSIKDGNYLEASEHGLDSKWAKQTPKRAKKLMQMLSNC